MARMFPHNTSRQLYILHKVVVCIQKQKEMADLDLALVLMAVLLVVLSSDTKQLSGIVQSSRYELVDIIIVP